MPRAWLIQSGFFFVNFVYLDARPSAEEQEVYDRVAHTLSFAPGILTELQSYKGAGEEIRIVSFCFTGTFHVS